MPTYDARGQELRNQLAAIQADLGGGETTRIAGVLQDYLAARDAVLTMITTLLADDDPTPVLDDYAARLRDMTRAATDRLDDMLAGLSTPSPAAVRFREQTSFAEFIFWGQVGALKLAQARDRMAADGRKVRDLIKVLDQKWQNLGEEDLRVEEAEQRAAQELKDLLEQALAEAMPYWLQALAGVDALREQWKAVFRSITDHVKEVLVGAGVPRGLVDVLLTLASWANDVATVAEWAARAGLAVPELLDWLNRIRSMNIGGYVQYRVGLVIGLDRTTKDVVSALNSAYSRKIKSLVEGQYDSRLAAFKAQLDNEGVIIVAYGGIRQQVDEFLKACNLDGVRAARAAAIAAMDGLDSALSTDGQKSDWSAVRKTLRDAFDARHQAAESAFNDFYRANDGRFLGGLSTETERTLLEPDKWRITTEGLVAVGLDTRLREWREKVTVVQGGPKDAFDAIRDQVQRGVNDYLTKQMTQLNAEAEQAIAVLEKSQLMVNAQKICTDMDRGRLQQALRATIR
jgi:hypothetical protein